jgi:serine/threonine protein kinase/tetratricopeptide (TPR) repeat protein
MANPSNRVKSIFLAAIDEHPPGQWPAFLDRACAGDLPLRAEVERLLRAQVAMGSFHEAPGAAEPATVDEWVAEAAGTSVGPYKLLRQIGEGGFGIVFRAVQQEPIRREVALKVLKPGMDTRQILARFEAERHALALMDHPHIARALDAGATDSGRPYFVMELVRGVPITEFCDQNQLAPAARLRLFLDVCRAIQHAHHKGVIHRDIKPTNVLVTPHDSVPVVKVIDFGVAKAIEQRLTERTLLTAHGQMIGTPAYMSPEQAELAGRDIDTRSDVYALGALLYELLTGTTPLDGKLLQAAGYLEVQRVIREEEAPRPSARVSSLADSAAVLAAHRGLDVKRLVRLLAGDLDWIVMKALEKDRNRRYDSPGNLADDIERYLRGEAVLARPPVTTYKVKKFARRHRTAVLTATAMAAALLAGTAVATWQAVRATRAGAEALAAALAARQAKDEAEAREAETRAVVHFVKHQVFAAARPEGPRGGLGPQVTLGQAVEASLPFVKTTFANQPLIEAQLRMTLGEAFWHLGKRKIAAEQYQIARGLYTEHLGPDHPDTLMSMHNLARCYHALGRYAEAFRLKEETLALRQARLGPDHPDTLHSMTNLSDSYTSLGRHAEALKLRQETLALREVRLGPDHPDTLHSIEDVANSYSALGKHADALRLREQTLALRKDKMGPDHPDTLKSMHNLANSYQALGRHADALRLREETLALRQRKLGPDHDDTLWTMRSVAESLIKLERGPEAVPILDECVRLAAHKVCCRRDLPPSVMSVRFRYFEKTRDAAGCRQTAEMWENLHGTDADGLYLAARIPAVTAAVLRAADTSPAGRRQAEAEADRALAWLNQAVAAGCKSARHLKQDRDFEALRGRADFAQLVARLEGVQD